MTVAEAIKNRIDAMLSDHGLPPDATDFGKDYLLECAVKELRWCLRLVWMKDGPQP